MQSHVHNTAIFPKQLKYAMLWVLFGEHSVIYSVHWTVHVLRLLRYLLYFLIIERVIRGSKVNHWIFNKMTHNSQTTYLNTGSTTEHAELIIPWCTNESALVMVWCRIKPSYEPITITPITDAHMFISPGLDV